METVNDCDDALKLDSSLIKLHLRKATALFRLGHFTSAEEAYSRVLEYNINDMTKLAVSHSIDHAEGSSSSAIKNSELKASLEELVTKCRADAKVGIKEVRFLPSLLLQSITKQFLS